MTITVSGIFNVRELNVIKLLGNRYSTFRWSIGYPYGGPHKYSVSYSFEDVYEYRDFNENFQRLITNYKEVPKAGIFKQLFRKICGRIKSL